MKRIIRILAFVALLGAGAGTLHAEQGETEAVTSDGRPVLLKNDGTWRYGEAKAKEKPDAKPAPGEVVLALERKVERGGDCRFEVRLTNNLPEEVRNLVLYYSAYRTSGIMYDSVSSESGSLKPGNTRTREIEFMGLPCRDIGRLQVGGGDRCEIGELHKFSDKKGQCLARVRVVESDLVRFDK